MYSLMIFLKFSRNFLSKAWIKYSNRQPLYNCFRVSLKCVSLCITLVFSGKVRSLGFVKRNYFKWLSLGNLEIRQSHLCSIRQRPLLSLKVLCLCLCGLGTLYLCTLFYLRPSCLILIGCGSVTLWVNVPLSIRAVLSAMPYLQLLYTVYCTMRYLLAVMPFFYLGCMRKLIKSTFTWGVRMKVIGNLFHMNTTLLIGRVKQFCNIKKAMAEKGSISNICIPRCLNWLLLV